MRYIPASAIRRANLRSAIAQSSLNAALLFASVATGSFLALALTAAMIVHTVRHLRTFANAIHAADLLAGVRRRLIHLDIATPETIDAFSAGDLAHLYRAGVGA